MPFAPSRRRLYVGSFVLILGGMILGLSASSIIQLIDNLTANARGLEAEAWVQQDRAKRAASLREAPPAVPRQGTVIVPGNEGYLLEIPAIGLRAVVRDWS